MRRALNATRLVCPRYLPALPSERSMFSFPSSCWAILTSQALRAVMTRKESFLSLPNWLTVPFQINPKDVFHRLLGLVFELCSILKAFDKEKELSSPGNGALFQLTLDCQHLHSRFQEWFESLKALYRGPLHILIPGYNFAPEDESAKGPSSPPSSISRTSQPPKQ